MGKITAVSPFVPESLPRLEPLDGVRFATAEAGIRYQGRTDLLVAIMDEGTTVAGVLTQSQTSSAPVLSCRKHLKKGAARILVVNSGNANAFTGRRGAEAVDITVEAAAAAADCKRHEVFTASTGVIGEPLDAAKFAPLLAGLAEAANARCLRVRRPRHHDHGYLSEARDPQGADRRCEVTINGFCKGAGMIAPDMATMLCFIFTDAAIASEPLQELLNEHVATTFNCMTVDGDTSTSDTCLLFATGKAVARGQVHVSKKGSRSCANSQRLFTTSCAISPSRWRRTARSDQIRDLRSARRKKPCGGAQNSSLVRQLPNSQDCHRRRGSELGSRGHGSQQIEQAADRDKLSIWFGEHCVARDGERAAEYDEATVAAYMKNREITIRIDAGVGKASGRVWTCDLTHDYVSINADYRS